MIWIKNHNTSGKSDNLRIPLRNEDAPVVACADDGDTTPVVKMREWTGLEIETHLPDEALENAFLDALGDQVIWAHKQDADHPDYHDKAEELDAYYNGTHPDIGQS